MLVIIEGADYASALSGYLEEFEKYKVLKVEIGRPFHRQLMEWEQELHNNRNVVIVGSHLRFMDSGTYNARQMRSIDGVLAELGFRLVWAIAEKERFNMTTSYVATAFFHSILPKVMFVQGQSVTNLIKWLNEDSRKNVLQSS
jgi:hypothetical protein